jgi:AbiV family abortive infection protein
MSINIGRGRGHPAGRRAGDAPNWQNRTRPKSTSMTESADRDMADEEIPNPLGQEIVAAQSACLEHARDLLASARVVRDDGRPHIAYHLVTLALEELGRRHLLGVQAVSSRSSDPPAWPRKAVVDHVGKLFWCFFGGNFLAEQITAEGLAGMKNLARRIHDTRLAGLYVDQSEEGLSVPKDAISTAELDQLLAFAEARLAMSAAEMVRKTVRRSEVERQVWFMAVATDPEKQRIVFSGGSLTKLAELKDVGAWADWLREQFEKADADAQAMAAAEIARSQRLPSEAIKDKWRMRLRIRSASHTIRQKALNLWNEKSNRLRLTVAKKDELILEITLGDNVAVEELWLFGWGLARVFVAALNIGSMGFWWWKLPEQVSRYYEQLYDLEGEHEFVVERSPILTVDWGKHRVLTEVDLLRVAACMAAMPGPGEQRERPACGYYLMGLTFLSLNDIHWQCEAQAFGNFMEAFRSMMIETGELQDAEAFPSEFTAFFDRTYGSTDDRDRIIGLVDHLSKRVPSRPDVDLRDVASMKFICDSYFLTHVLPRKRSRPPTSIDATPTASPTEPT